MNKPLLNVMAAVSLLCCTAGVFADNELVVNAYKNGKAATGLVAKLDGEEERILDDNGLTEFDLQAGSHSIQILENGNPIHSFRFESAAGQFADISVSLEDGEKPQVSVDTYFKNETPIQRVNAKTGGVTGTVRSNGQPVVDAQITVEGTDVSVKTDADGNYELELPRGIYQLSISHPEFGNKDIADFRVVSNVTKGSNFTISPTRSEIEEVVVLAKINTSAADESERYSVNVIETLGVEQLARFGDSDVGAAVIRVPSVTVQDSRYIFIRGLGGRYITTTLNGATLPSTDPAKRTVPLDLFPSNIVNQLDVKKTFITSMPGESTGGNLVINTRTFPNDKTGKLSVSVGYVDGLTGEDVATDPHNGSWDFVGWDDGTREEDVTVTAIAKALDPQFSEFLSPSDVRELSRTAALLLKDDIDLDTRTANPDISIGANYGDVFDLEKNDAELGFFAALNYKNTWSNKESGISRTYTVNGSDVLDDLTFTEQSNDVDVSGLLSLSLIRGDDVYQSNTVISRITESRVEQYAGIDGDSSLNTRSYTIFWEERQFISQQFTGEHFLDEEGNFIADWQVTFSQATRLAPDRREVRFDLEDADGVFNLVVPNVLRVYEDLTDDNIDFSVNLKNLLDASGDSESSISYGLQTITRERDSDSTTYGFIADQSSFDDNAPNLRVDDVINTGNITGDQSTGLAFIDKTLASDSYEAQLDLNSVYVNYDNLFLNEYQVVVGVRYEDYEQETQTFSLQGDQGAVPSVLDEDILLPSLSFNWYFREDQQIRFAVSQTVSRPDFKETSNATFYDKELRKRVRGNPNLEVSEVTNFDVRWEKYWSDNETLSVALFYKDLNDPIERVELPASGTASDSRTFQNSEAAILYGIELDGRKDFGLNEAMTKTLFIALNASFIESEVDLVGKAKRQLQGQPEYTFNLILGFDDIVNDQELTVLFNQNGKSISDVGINTQPDVIEESRMDIKINYKYYLDEDIVLKANVSNLLDSDYEFTQGGNIRESYRAGVEFQAGIEWDF